jgi:glyoxylase I family protein
MINAIHHVSLIVENTDRSLKFYCGVLGLKQENSRPEMEFPGAWLQVGEAEIHLLELPNPDSVSDRPEHGGRDRHLAMHVSDLSQIEAALKQSGVTYTMSKSGRRALFCRDPDGNALELIESTIL